MNKQRRNKDAALKDKTTRRTVKSPDYQRHMEAERAMRGGKRFSMKGR